MKHINKEKLLILIILLIGVIFRFYNPNWDSGHFFHPDERNIANSVGQIKFFSQLNPHFFAYGSFPIYLYRATGEIINSLTKTTDWTGDWAKINIIGRVWSSFFSSLALIFVYKLAKAVFDKKIAFLAFFFTTFTPFLIQTAHFAVTESLLSLFILVLTYLSIKLIKAPSIKQTLILSIVSGLALATKTSAITFFIPPVIAFLYLVGKNLKHKHYDHAIDYGFKLILFFFLSFLFFFIIDPYVLLDFTHFKQSMDYEGGIVLGKLIVVYVYQFINTLPYIYWIKNWFFTQGPFLASVSLLGGLYTIWLLISSFWGNRRRRMTPESIRQTQDKSDSGCGFRPYQNNNKITFLILSLWPLLYFVYVGSWFTKFVRYLVPFYPFLSIFAAKLLIDGLNLAKKTRALEKSMMFLIVLIAGSTFIYSCMFMTIYITPQTRILTSNWVYNNIPEGSKILGEHWDEGLPIPTKEGTPGRYTTEQLTIYEPDNSEKVKYYADKLSSADYIIINSKRLYGTLLYLPKKYPITSKYYEYLFSGKLGYTLIQEFTSYPRLEIGKLKLELNDDAVEESFQVYDHPKNLIFKNTGHFPKEQMQEKLTQP